MPMICDCFFPTLPPPQLDADPVIYSSGPDTVHRIFIDMMGRAAFDRLPILHLEENAIGSPRFIRDDEMTASIVRGYAPRPFVAFRFVRTCNDHVYRGIMAIFTRYKDDRSPLVAAFTGACLFGDENLRQSHIEYLGRLCRRELCGDYYLVRSQ